MIDDLTIEHAAKLKKVADAAYLVFKKSPTTVNAATWTQASRDFNTFCVDAISKLIEEDITDKTAEILANADKYKTCNQCGAKLLYLTSDTNYVASSDFLEDFPGWCYPCLLEYCTTHNCEGCTVTSRPSNCSFLDVKNLHLQESTLTE